MAKNLDNIVGALRAAGLNVVETPGWFTRGYAGQDFQEIRGVLWHHTATNRARFVNSDAPTLQMCIDGRPDVAGPLCNIVFGRNGTVYLVATGVANHAGAGELTNIPRNWGNHYLVGIEMESSGIAPWDWTPEQIRLAPLLGAVLERELLMHLPAELRIQASHQEYSSEGKIDPAGWPGGMDGLRNSINEILNGNASPVAPAPMPTPTPVPAPAPVYGPTTRRVSEAVAWARTAPYSNAPAAPGYPEGIARGATVVVNGYVKGEDVSGQRDDAWFRTKSGFYIWANQLGNDISGIEYVGDMSSSVPKPAPAPTPSGTTIPHGDGELHWIVEPGDTLAKICAHYYGADGPSYIEKVAAHNGIHDKNNLHVGQKVWAVGPIRWVIEAPDTVQSICAYYSISWEWLAARNPGQVSGPWSELYIGNVLVIL